MINMLDHKLIELFEKQPSDFTIVPKDIFNHFYKNKDFACGPTMEQEASLPDTPYALYCPHRWVFGILKFDEKKIRCNLNEVMDNDIKTYKRHYNDLL